MNLIYLLANHPCEDPEILKIIYYIREILGIAFTVIPIVLIVLITFDFIKSVAAGNEDTMKKNQKIVIKRIIYCLMVFLVIPIVNLAFSAFKTSGNEGLISDNGVNYLSCWANADDIASIQALIIGAEFKTNGGSTMGGTSLKCGGTESCEIILPNATKIGYTLKGWQKNEEPEILQNGHKVTIKKGDVFTAIWVENPKEEDVITDKEILDKENEKTPNKEEGGNNKENNPSGDNQPPNTPSTPIILSDDIETRIQQMIDFAKTLEGKSQSGVKNSIASNESFSFDGDWCSWFGWNMYYTYNLINKGTWDGSYDNTDELAYASGWIFMGKDTYNGYYEKRENNKIVGDANYVPQPGDLVLFLWDGSGHHRASHVGIVTAVGDGTISTVEGNSYPDYNVNIKEHKITSGAGKYIGNVSAGQIVGYYSLRKSISEGI